MELMKAGYSDYGYKSADPIDAHTYLIPAVEQLLPGQRAGARLLDLGCGSGAVASVCSNAGWRVTGVDLSISGIELAKSAYPSVEFMRADVCDADLPLLVGSNFDAIVSCEVLEHLYNPRAFVKNAYSLLAPGGALILSVPYHGYLKNLALALTARFDTHFTALWDGGHIKFWSWPTIRKLLQEAGFQNIEFHGAGRVPWLWKSMVIRAVRAS